MKILFCFTYHNDTLLKNVGSDGRLDKTNKKSAIVEPHFIDHRLYNDQRNDQNLIMCRKIILDSRHETIENKFNTKAAVRVERKPGMSFPLARTEYQDQIPLHMNLNSTGYHLKGKILCV